MNCLQHGFFDPSLRRHAAYFFFMSLGNIELWLIFGWTDLEKYPDNVV